MSLLIYIRQEQNELNFFLSKGTNSLSRYYSDYLGGYHINCSVTTDEEVANEN